MRRMVNLFELSVNTESSEIWLKVGLYFLICVVSVNLAIR